MSASNSFHQEVMSVLGRAAGTEDANFPKHKFDLHEASGYEVEREYRFSKTSQFIEAFGHSPQVLGLQLDRLCDERGEPADGVLMVSDALPYLRVRSTGVIPVTRTSCKRRSGSSVQISARSSRSTTTRTA